MPLPENIDPGKENRSACIDECIVDVIKHLWKNNISTQGCCCGHGKRNPDIVIEQKYSQDECDKLMVVIGIYYSGN